MVTGPAYGNQRASSALQFSQALFASGHQISTIFFYQEGVYNANRFSAPAIDEVDIVRAWHKLATQYQITLHVCIAAALRRGVTNAEQAELIALAGDNLQSSFHLSGLGKLAEALLECDRFIQF
ncbi:sulfurtransferase complex subunit TusD [Candidatus Hoaglandella endobia]|uniref:Sulfurtransferase TusD n=1 Tax=Candidatus Hoaglandella endobia TaxID=1778263 RepID=A0A143WUC7_9ENTR|nr:sulfurtransferase complex subunit TusD [Candidatus Hoaglandella endobia]CUX97363.1 Sulfurtransferase TusD [Candidatus Hoaglandella endobia]